ncbi:hypothetical protein LTR17_016003 [Elasticomyces elasticus]|nr:hypothetical protein LTR17_016003 [Elasticomyces elasticus]
MIIKKLRTCRPELTMVDSTSLSIYEFSVHKDVVTNQSTCFKAAVGGRWKGSNTPVHLRDDEPNVFADYMKHLYFGELHFMDDGGEPKDAAIRAWIDVYSLADKLGDLTVMNIYKHTASTSQLRRLVVDLYVHDYTFNDVDYGYLGRAVELALVEFCVDMVKEMKKLKERGARKKVSETFSPPEVLLSSSRRLMPTLYFEMTGEPWPGKERRGTIVVVGLSDKHASRSTDL